ncbi:MAG: YcgL domain-containing protein [Parahaliea sp.]
MKRLCEVFASSAKAEMYLYVDRARGLRDVPEPLLKQFGEPRPVMTLVLTPERKLARTSATEVLAGIEDKGFYLQMPPSDAELAQRERADR